MFKKSHILNFFLHYDAIDNNKPNLYFVIESNSYGTHLKMHIYKQLIFVQVPNPCQCSNIVITVCDNNVCAIQFYYKCSILVNLCPMAEYR
jgi:hypothetical protein